MIDLHSHILPGIDDGSPNLETTRAMLLEMAAQGVQVVVATPHFYAFADRPDGFLERRSAALEKTAQLKEVNMTVLPGAEVAYFDGISHSELLPQLQLGSSGHVLIEMPFCPWTQRMIQEVCDVQPHTGLIPVLAHVNRYCRRNQLLGCIDMLLDSGVLFQCNAEAFLSPFSRRWALQQVKAGNIHFLGSDAHNLTIRAPKLKQAGAVIEKKLGKEVLENITAFSAEILKL